LLGEQGLLFRDGKEHLALRRRLNRAFKPAALKTYLAIMNERIAERVSSWPTGTQPRLAEEVRRLTLDIAAQAIAGAEVGPESDSVIRHFIRMLGASTSFGPALPGTAKWKGARGRAYMDHYFRRQITERRAGAGEDMFSLICRGSGDQHLCDDEIVDNMIGGLLAAYETTATTLMMMLYFLARHPQWQERLRNEYATTETLGRMRFDALEELVETEWVLKETLRLNPPLPVLPRRATRSFEFEGHEIPAGARLIISPAFIHRMPSIYPDPEAFTPERFAESNGQDKTHPCAWIPFGKGSHTCMGMHMARLEVKTFFAHVLARFRLEISQEHELEMRYLPVMGPAGAGLPIRLCERKDSVLKDYRNQVA
jgi:cytochrome P450